MGDLKRSDFHATVLVDDTRLDLRRAVRAACAPARSGWRCRDRWRESSPSASPLFRPVHGLPEDSRGRESIPCRTDPATRTCDRHEGESGKCVSGHAIGTLGQSNRAPAPCVEQESFAPGLDEGARAHSLGAQGWRSRSEKSHLDACRILRRLCDCRGTEGASDDVNGKSLHSRIFLAGCALRERGVPASGTPRWLVERNEGQRVVGIHRDHQLVCSCVVAHRRRVRDVLGDQLRGAAGPDA